MNEQKKHSTPAHFAPNCPSCGGNGDLLQGCKTGFGGPSCNDGLECRNYMGLNNICVPANIGTRGNRCVPGYGDLMTCYDNSDCVAGMCVNQHKRRRHGHNNNVKNMNGWVIAAIIAIIILLIILLVIGLVGNGNGKGKGQSKK